MRTPDEEWNCVSCSATVRDVLCQQRRRIYAGHLRIRDQQAYSVPTMSAWQAARALLRPESFATPKTALWTVI